MKKGETERDEREGWRSFEDIKKKSGARRKKGV